VSDSAKAAATSVEQMNQLEKQIDQSLATLQHLNQANEEIVGMTATINDISEQTNLLALSQIDAMVEEVIRRSEHMQRVIYETTTISFLNTVKLDHAVWKNEVYQRIHQQRFNELMVDHSSCRLGKWYFKGYGSRNYRHLQSFQDMDAPHKAVHTYGNQALEAGGRGDFESMAAALEAMEDASQQVVHCLDQLEQDIVQRASH